MMRARCQLPVPPGVNHQWRIVRSGGGGRARLALTSAAVEWRDAAWILLRTWARENHWPCYDTGWVVAWYWIWWPDARRRDADNIKLLFDAGQGILYDDDKRVLPRAVAVGIDRAAPRVEVAWRWHPGSLADRGTMTGAGRRGRR